MINQLASNRVESSEQKNSVDHVAVDALTDLSDTKIEKDFSQFIHDIDTSERSTLVEPEPVPKEIRQLWKFIFNVIERNEFHIGDYSDEYVDGLVDTYGLEYVQSLCEGVSRENIERFLQKTIFNYIEGKGPPSIDEWNINETFDYKTHFPQFYELIQDISYYRRLAYNHALISEDGKLSDDERKYDTSTSGYVSSAYGWQIITTFGNPLERDKFLEELSMERDFYKKCVELGQKYNKSGEAFEDTVNRVARALNLRDTDKIHEYTTHQNKQADIERAYLQDNYGTFSDDFLYAFSEYLNRSSFANSDDFWVGYDSGERAPIYTQLKDMSVGELKSTYGQQLKDFKRDHRWKYFWGVRPDIGEFIIDGAATLVGSNQTLRLIRHKHFKEHTYILEKIDEQLKEVGPAGNVRFASTDWTVDDGSETTEYVGPVVTKEEFEKIKDHPTGEQVFDIDKEFGQGMSDALKRVKRERHYGWGFLDEIPQKEDQIPERTPSMQVKQGEHKSTPPIGEQDETAQTNSIEQTYNHRNQVTFDHALQLDATGKIANTPENIGYLQKLNDMLAADPKAIFIGGSNTPDDIPAAQVEAGQLLVKQIDDVLRYRRDEYGITGDTPSAGQISYKVPSLENIQTGEQVGASPDILRMNNE